MYLLSPVGLCAVVPSGNAKASVACEASRQTSGWSVLIPTDDAAPASVTSQSRTLTPFLAVTIPIESTFVTSS